MIANANFFIHQIFIKLIVILFSKYKKRIIFVLKTIYLLAFSKKNTPQIFEFITRIISRCIAFTKLTCLLPFLNQLP